LDPEASRTVLNFIKTLREEGRTIVLTTHILPEADEMCDLICIFQTRLIRLDSPDRLRAGLFGRGVEVHLVGDVNGYINTARSLSFVKYVISTNDALSIQLDDPDGQTPALVRALVEAGAQIRSVMPISHSLEDVYLQLVGAKNVEAKP
jgi:ABC-2 type transport system ATP-binding protein